METTANPAIKTPVIVDVLCSASFSSMENAAPFIERLMTLGSNYRVRTEPDGLVVVEIL